ncbi:hypothetical protein K9M42_01245 [Patescibacteria group bacterium]|nr:hypothetical protein [Patescibacteria group bacterium]
MKKIKVYFIFILSFLFLIILYIFFISFILKDLSKTSLKKSNFKVLENENLLVSNKVVKNEKYNFEIQSPYKTEFKNDYKFLTLKDENCVLNIVSFINNDIKNVCDWVEKECLDLECSNYICEYYKNDWYKVRYFGDFMGSSDYELVYKYNNYIYSANLECFSYELDNYKNPLFSNLILNFNVKKDD